ncbi:MAG: 50S ribosomal protein L10 [Deltaproteobacteria bacterium]
MALKRPEKEKQVEDIKAKFGRAQAAFIAEYKGVKAMGMNEIRSSLRDASVELKVVRNTLARRAVKGTAAEPLTEHLKGSAAIIFSYKDAVLAAKKLMGFASEQPNLKLRAGLLGSKLISLKEIKALSELPSRDVLLGRLIGTLNLPATRFVFVLGGVSRKFIYALNAIKEKKA